MHAWQSLIANSKATKPVKPCNGSLDHPAGLAQAAAVFGSAPCNLGGDTSAQQGSSARVGAIASISLEQFGSALGSAPFPRYWGNGIHQRQQLRDIVAIGLGQNGRERNALRVNKEVVLRTGTTAIGWVRSRFFPAPKARMEELSATAREKSMRSASRSLESSTWCRRFHTPALCHALSRRQQVDPDPQPISSGSIFQGMPERSTKTIPVNAARSDTAGRRPGCFLRRRLGRGRSASISVHNSSSISGLDIAPLKGKQCRS